MKRLCKPRRVALAVLQGLPFLERLLLGITEHARRHEQWTFTRLPDFLGPSIGWLRHWSGDGAFAFITTHSDVRVAGRLPFPVVNLAAFLDQKIVPTVTVDHERVGQLAARHLIERGFHHFGYVGTALWYSQLRGKRFSKTVSTAGGNCRSFQLEVKPGARNWRDQERQLKKWLSSLVKPVGILAATDLRATMVLEACRQLGLRVPEEVAVMGVDNDPIIAEFADPQLTSVSRNDREVGRQAAALLGRLMGGAKPPSGPLFVPPDGIIQRKSTETIAVSDPIVAQAIAYVRDNIHRSFGVEELLNKVPLSRRSLEYHFRESLSCSPYDFINRMRIDAAKKLLADPNRPKISAVSNSCGFSNPSRFCQVFTRLTGTTPTAFRRSLATAASR